MYNVTLYNNNSYVINFEINNHYYQIKNNSNITIKLTNGNYYIAFISNNGEILNSNSYINVNGNMNYYFLIGTSNYNVVNSNSGYIILFVLFMSIFLIAIAIKRRRSEMY